MAAPKDLTSGLTAERLREVLSYDPETGGWAWRQRRGRRATVGGIRKSSGYCRIGIDGGLYRSSRLAVPYMTGEWPKDEIDHVNCNKADDRWENLREATHTQNQRNDGLYKNSWTGVKGVYLCRERGHPPVWRAQISINGRHRSLRCYGTLEEAAAVYAKLAREYHGEFARTE